MTSNSTNGPNARPPRPIADQSGKHGFPAAFPDFLHELWGLWWAVTAAQSGPLVASSDALPEGEESIALVLAKRFARSKRQRTFARRMANSKARRATRAVVELRRLARSMPAGGPELAAAMLAADRVGRSAAKTNRVHFLIAKLAGAAQ
ncbi:hypothetical protein [Phenylobacterium sp.]|uniref:hypothetical protein n=1 Tax=Phenylobacterium sp. TaxID=1871053 RepID=UPI002BC25A77|nr:hypothetical protein [Phenylobacterium sp.]HVI33182.1 hypothetical protein [Phenylobacterium sp.]